MVKKDSRIQKALGLESALVAFVPQLGRGLVMHEPEVYRLTVKLRGAGDWLAIANKDGDDGGPLVAFGSGYDFVSALAGLDGAIAAGRWRVDRPYNGEKAS